MHYRKRFGRSRKRRRTSKTLRRVSSSTKIRAVESRPRGRPLALRATVRPARTEQPPTPFEERFRIEAVVHREGPVRLSHVIERETGQRLTLAVCQLRGEAGWDAWDRFKHGCMVLKSLRHRRIPIHLEHVEHDSSAYLLMQRIPGQTLQRAMQDQRRFSDTQLLHMLKRGLEVLDYLHDLNPPVYHGDSHPGSVFVSDRGDLTLASFDRSVSRMLDRYDPLAHAWRVGYAAPELAVEPPGPATDVYAWGATILAVATGRDAAMLPIRGGVDVEACIKPGPLREALADLVSPVAALRLEAARSARAQHRAR